MMGNPERALDLLEKVVKKGFGSKDWFENDPDFASLHEEPRFRELIRQLGAKPSSS
jgi:hypothetical protein